MVNRQQWWAVRISRCRSSCCCWPQTMNDMISMWPFQYNDFDQTPLVVVVTCSLVFFFYLFFIQLIMIFYVHWYWVGCKRNKQTKIKSKTKYSRFVWLSRNHSELHRLVWIIRRSQQKWQRSYFVSRIYAITGHPLFYSHFILFSNECFIHYVCTVASPLLLPLLCVPYALLLFGSASPLLRVRLHFLCKYVWPASLRAGRCMSVLVEPLTVHGEHISTLYKSTHYSYFQLFWLLLFFTRIENSPLLASVGRRRSYRHLFI